MKLAQVFAKKVSLAKTLSTKPQSFQATTKSAEEKKIKK
ncbi:hypothetical protein BF30_943 [Francisella philomiragia]|nr:hypothetical protein BF30_943 [Francisella philomiragia]AJI49512.1 hypothetical protein KU46_612 [Francisella philomiragia]